MQFNFSLKRAWSDLFSDKKYIWQLLAIMVICIFLELLGDVHQIRGPRFLATIILLGYTSLIAYNIINAKDKVLENIFNNHESSKFILLVGLKAAIIESIYLLGLLIPGSPLLMFLIFKFHLGAELATLFMFLILSPILFYITIFPTIVFAQKLKFIDAFNFKKAFNTLKLAWKDYLVCFVILTVLFFGIFIFCFSIFYTISLIQNNVTDVNVIASRFLHLQWAYLSNKLPQNSVFMSLANVISCYFATHITAQVYKSTLKEENIIETQNLNENSQIIENKEKNMEINFGIKKIWNDLVESKQSLKYLLTISSVIIVFGIIDVFIKAKIFSSIVNLVLGGYFVLMINNIIHDKKPVLENLGQAQNENRNLAIIVFQFLGIGIIYLIATLTLGFILFLIFSKMLGLAFVPAIIASVILLLPFIILASFANLLFAENLKFGDAFNLKKAFNSFKIAWGKYLAIFGICILLFIGFIILLFLMAVPIGIMVALFIKNYPIIANTNASSKLAGMILGSVIGEIFGIAISYWYTNATAQIYKYTLNKMS